MKKALVCLFLVSSYSPASNAGFWGHVAEHAAGYAAGAIAAHEGDKVLDGYKMGIHGDLSPESQSLPNPSITPGRLNPAVTQQNIQETICRRGGYTKSIRPSESYTYDLKVKQIREYGYSDTRLADYEEDHLISLELGGSPDSPENLWPEPHSVVGGWGSFAKDRLEDKLHDLVCSGQMTLARAQHEIATDWIGSYKAHIGGEPNDVPLRY